jgi:L-lactate dehydrogenase complex protein LldG
MSARDAILGRIQSALNAEHPQRPAPASVDDAPPIVSERLAKKPVSTLPAYSEDPTERLIRLMESVEMTVTRVQTPDDVVTAVEDYLYTENLVGDVTVAPALGNMAWPETFRTGAASGVETTSVTPCFAAVAETGSVVMASTGSTPATLNFLPDNHIVVVNESQVVRHVDDVWTRWRDESGNHRALNFVTGPSRTGDIEQTIEIGAHGPRRMHVILVAGA